MHSTDLDLTGKHIGELSSPDAIARFFERLGYKISARTPLTPESIGLAGDSAASFRKIELFSEDEEGFLRVVFAQPKSLTAKARTDLVRVLGKATTDHLLVLASDYETLEFVLLDKRKREQQGPGGVERVQVTPKTISVSRRAPTRLDLRTVRRFTWTSRDAIDQFDKLRSVFDAAVYTGEYFQNRGLFADYFLRDRLREDGAWRDNPADMFAFVRDLYQDSQTKWQGQDKEAMRGGLFKPVFERLGFKPVVNRPSKTDQTQPDYLLKDAAGRVLSAAFVYQWDRWLDGPDQNDPDTPEENPGACVVSALDQGQADWVVVTNGRLWRLYSRQAHARSTNFYEVDLVEALTASGDTDPNEAFRYFWLFFRVAAFRPPDETPKVCWLNAILLGSREYAKRLGERLKDRVFVTVFPHLAEGLLADRRQRLGEKSEPTREELDDIFEATLTFLYRLLFLLYAESRDLLPIREAPYQAASFKKLKEVVAQKAGVAQAEVPARLEKAYSAKEAALYDALGHLFEAMDRGDPALNVPTYNGGLFITKPGDLDRREHRIAKFLLDHKVPDRYLALAIDLLARDQDEKSFSLAFIDYKSLEVRHLGSIYEGLLEFRLKIAPEDLTTQADAKNAKVERYVALSQVKGGKAKRNGQAVVVKKGDVYLSNSKAERKASGSYYTPDSIVEYIVANAVGPVLDAKLAALEPEFRKVRKTFNNELQKSEAYPSAEVRAKKTGHRQWAGLKTYLAHQDLVERFFDLKVVDPAMGSGHFLVEAVDFVTDRLLKFLNQFPINPVNFALDKTRTSILESLGEQGVTVDPTKLTDINLLKRHVLKRCIYGVDLNPMAVELAKVSLWLDAFTLGAPLSFLDHHLRCGNSLVGASYRDLKKATERLWALDTEPLLRAIQHVLFVSKMSDATAAEATQSADRFTQARKALSGYRIIFDCLTAKDFGEPDATGIVESGQEFKLANRELFLESVTAPDDRALISRADALAQRPEHRFFYWEIEFPEVFFGFRDSNERQPKHRDELEAGTAGFDVVIGNPPYDVLAEKELEADLGHLLAYFKKEKTYEPACKDKQNLYKLFICRGVLLLRTGGRIGHIVPMTLLGDEQSVGVRKMLLNKTALTLVEAFPQKDDPKNHPQERVNILKCFAPIGSGDGICPGDPIDVLVSTDVLSEGQNLQDCGAIINYDLTWNPIRLVQRNGRIDRIGSPHDEIGIYNMFPEDELEALLKLVERLTDRISTIDDLGLLDSSVLGEVVHPRTFNTLRRIRDEDGTVLDEEEARAELAGPEMLLKHLKEMLGKGSQEALEALPNGIHSGLRRDKCNGVFFYFQAPRSDGQGRRHLWRYIDAANHGIKENRFEIAQVVACPPEEPRFVGDQDVFVLQDKVIDHILAAEREVEARAAAPTAVDPIQQTVAETVKDAIRRRSVERDAAKTGIAFLGQPMGKAVHTRLRAVYDAWASSRDDKALVQQVGTLADQFGKEREAPAAARRLRREDLELICFEYVSS